MRCSFVYDCIEHDVKVFGFGSNFPSAWGYCGNGHHSSCAHARPRLSNGLPIVGKRQRGTVTVIAWSVAVNRLCLDGIFKTAEDSDRGLAFGHGSLAVPVLWKQRFSNACCPGQRASSAYQASAGA